jgi:hypothetical protein
MGRHPLLNLDREDVFVKLGLKNLKRPDQLGHDVRVQR